MIPIDCNFQAKSVAAFDSVLQCAYHRSLQKRVGHKGSTMMQKAHHRMSGFDEALTIAEYEYNVTFGQYWGKKSQIFMIPIQYYCTV